MPRSYPADLRWHVVWMHVYLGKEVKEIAEVMKVSERSVYRYSERYLITGDVRPFIRRNGPVRELSEFEQHYLVDLVLAKPGMYLRELQEELYLSMLHWVDSSTILRTLHRIGMSRQVLKHYSLQRSELCRSNFWLEFHYFHPSMMVWIDESGFDKRNSLRKYSYGIRNIILSSSEASAIQL